MPSMEADLVVVAAGEGEVAEEGTAIVECHVEVAPTEAITEGAVEEVATIDHHHHQEGATEQLEEEVSTVVVVSMAVLPVPEVIMSKAAMAGRHHRCEDLGNFRIAEEDSAKDVVAGWVEAVEVAGVDSKCVQTIGPVHAETTTSAGERSATNAKCRSLMVEGAEVEVMAGLHEVVDTKMPGAIPEEEDKTAMEGAEVVGRCVAQLAEETDIVHIEMGPISLFTLPP